ncbi:MAG TPA: hypothetical protein VFQ91_11635 [Bryobacteraceae bacterium]|nr:hypothetical protein [Bryobacteraceae bacterium]
MSKWIVVLTLLALPAFGQWQRVDNLKSFRQDLAAAVSNGNLTADEKQKYEAALHTLDERRAARKSGQGSVDRNASRQALRDLAEISRSTSLQEGDRAKLAKHLSKGRKGKHAPRAKSPAA